MAEPGWKEMLPSERWQAVVNAYETTPGGRSPTYVRGVGVPDHVPESWGNALRGSLDQVERTLPNGPAVNRSRWRTLADGKWIGSIRRLYQTNTAFRLLSRGVGVGGAALFIYEYGSGLGKLFGESRPEPAGIVSLTWQAAGEPRCPGYVSNGSATSQVSDVAGCPNGEPYIPVGFLKGLITHDGTGVNPTWLRDCNANPVTPNGSVPVDGTSLIATSSCPGWTIKPTTAFSLDVMADTLIPEDPPQRTRPPGWGAASPSTEYGGSSQALQAPSSTAAEREAALETALELAENTAVRRQIEWVLNKLAQVQADYEGLTAPELVPPDPDTDSPAAGVVSTTMPNCRGLTVAACISAMEATGWEGTTTVSVRTFNTADVTLPAETVVDTSPISGGELLTNTNVTIERNPDVADMPLAIPAPLPSEVYWDYIERLQDLGLVGQAQSLSDATMDLTVGPNVVVRTSPDTGTRVATGSEVVVVHNPPTAPPVEGGGGSPTPLPGTCTPWAEPALDFSPLTDLEPGNVFPFAIPFWINDVLDQWVGTPVTPEWDFVFPFGGEFTVDLHIFDDYMPAIRTVLFVLALASLLWLFVQLAYGSIGGRSGSSD